MKLSWVSLKMKCEPQIFCFFLQKSPPYIFSPIPFLGHAIAFGKSPIEFLENAYEKVSLPNNTGKKISAFQTFFGWQNTKKVRSYAYPPV